MGLEICGIGGFRIVETFAVFLSKRLKKALIIALFCSFDSWVDTGSSGWWYFWGSATGSGGRKLAGISSSTSLLVSFMISFSW
jgi:hypothetical protein